MSAEQKSETQRLTMSVILSSRLESVREAVKNLAGEISASNQVLEKFKENVSAPVDVELTQNIRTVFNLLEVAVMDVKVGLSESNVRDSSKKDSEILANCELPNKFEDSGANICKKQESLDPNVLGLATNPSPPVKMELESPGSNWVSGLLFRSDMLFEEEISETALVVATE